MREIPSKKRLITAGLTAVAILGLSFYYTTYPAGGEKAPSAEHLKALESYKKKAYKQALATLEPHIEDILMQKEGCELVISVLATTQKLGPVRDAALSCMKRGKATGLSHEAYAMSMASVGKFDEAIPVLEAEAKKLKDARVHAAIAQLYVFSENNKAAQDHLLKAIKIGKPWSTWFARVFTAKAFREDKVFLRNLVPLIASKKDVIADLEFRLIDILEKKQLTLEAETLKKRLKKAAGSIHGTDKM